LFSSGDYINEYHVYSSEGAQIVHLGYSCNSL